MLYTNTPTEDCVASSTISEFTGKLTKIRNNKMGFFMYHWWFVKLDCCIRLMSTHLLVWPHQVNDQVIFTGLSSLHSSVVIHAVSSVSGTDGGTPFSNFKHIKSIKQRVTDFSQNEDREGYTKWFEIKINIWFKIVHHSQHRWLAGTMNGFRISAAMMTA